MERRRSAAMLAWAIPLGAILGVTTVASDVDLDDQPTAADAEVSTSQPTTELDSTTSVTTPPVTTTVAVPTVAADAVPGAAPGGIHRLSPPPQQGSGVFEQQSREPASQPPVVDPEPSTTSPPAATPAETPPTDLVQSEPPANDYVLDIPSIELSAPVVAGGQAEIDQGNVTAVDWSSRGYPASCQPSDGCTVWLAGHRSSHGAVFARLPELTVGVPITIHFQGQTYAYAVTEVDVVPGPSPPSVIAGDLVLQTSLPRNQRILIYADGV